jgi:hypothetical protein
MTSATTVEVEAAQKAAEAAQATANQALAIAEDPTSQLAKQKSEEVAAHQAGRVAHVEQFGCKPSTI